MAQSLRNLAEALAEVVRTDTDVIAAVGNLTVLKGNVQFARLTPKQLPVLVLELGDGRNDDDEVGGNETIGNYAQVPIASVTFAIVFSAEVRESAWQKRADAVDAVIRALLRNPTLNTGSGDSAEGAWIAEWDTDRGDAAMHPRHWLSFEARAYYRVEA